MLFKKDGKLIDAYERVLLELQDPHYKGASAGNAGSAEREEQLRKLVDLKLQTVEDAQFKFTVGKTEINVKQQINKIAGAILYAKSFIGSVASAEPHTALAWAGISVLLPVSSGL